MPMALPFPTRLSPSSNFSVIDNVDEVRFDDGYYDSAPRSMFQPESWDVVYRSLNIADSDVVLAALRTVGTWDYFTWTPTYESVQKKWKVVRGTKQVSHPSPLRRQISFTLIQVP